MIAFQFSARFATFARSRKAEEEFRRFEAQAARAPFAARWPARRRAETIPVGVYTFGTSASASGLGSSPRASRTSLIE